MLHLVISSHNCNDLSLNWYSLKSFLMKKTSKIQKNMVWWVYKQVKSRGYRFLLNCKDLGPSALRLHSLIKTSPLAFNLHLKS
jgi:hypothetical protein